LESFFNIISYWCPTGTEPVEPCADTPPLNRLIEIFAYGLGLPT